MLSDAGLAYGMGVMDESMNRMHEFSMNDERMARVLSVRRPIKQASPRSSTLVLMMISAEHHKVANE